MYHPFIHLVQLHLGVFFYLFIRACHISYIFTVSVIEIKLVPWVRDQVWESSAQLHRGQPEPKEAGAELLRGDFVWTLHRPFQVPKPQDLERTSSVFSWRQSSMHWISYHRAGSISLSSSRYYRLRVSDTLEIWWCAIKCLLVCIYYCVHMASDWCFGKKRLTWVKHFRCFDHKNISSLWRSFGFKVTGNIMYLRELSHTEIIWTSALRNCVPVILQEILRFIQAKGEQQRNLVGFFFTSTAFLFHRSYKIIWLFSKLLMSQYNALIGFIGGAVFQTYCTSVVLCVYCTIKL